jgi:hypothetical protein
LAPLLAARQPVRASQLELARAAWQAFTGSDPVAVEQLLTAGTAALPFLANAMRRLLEEFPSARNGLARCEEQALRAAAELPSPSAGRMFQASQEMEESPFMGDTSFWQTLVRLAEAPHPLLRLSADTGNEFIQKAVEITELGSQMLWGDLDCVRLRGINKWIGGVHLQGAEARWRWNGSGLVEW